MAGKSVMTLGQFIIERQKEFGTAKGSFSRLINDIAIAAKFITREVRKAGLAEILGAAGMENIQGEEVQKLDVMANDQLIAALRAGGECCVLGSEENDDIIPFDPMAGHDPQYVVLFDPLDGSSNIDANVSIGTIFSIFKRVTDSGAGTKADCLQAGMHQIAAGYVIYGSSTMLVYTTGKGVNGFTLDPSIGEFCLSHPDIKTPKDGKIYSVNEGNISDFGAGVVEFIDWCKQKDKDSSRPFSSRYIGSFVADFHRNLLKGGIFLYPPTAKAPKGKLRLLYEANPLAFIVEQAGGMASDGTQRVLEIVPTDLHQRTPLFIGSENLVKKAMEFLNKN